MDNLLNQQFGKLKVIGYGRNNKYICKCSCGLSKEFFVRKADLINGIITHCGCEDGKNIEGKKFGKLTVVRLYSVTNRIKRWLCDCDCGNTNIIVSENVLVNGLKWSCGNCRYDDLSGQVFGKLTVIKSVTKNAWLCKCSCGSDKEIIVYAWALKSGDINNCGCGERLSIDDNNYNPYKVLDDGTTVIYAANTGTKFYIDSEDYNRIKQYKWVEAKGGYIGTRLKGGKFLSIHNVILNIKDNHKNVVIYVDGDKKNIRKNNLKIVDRQQYIKERRIRSNNKTGYTGVSLYGKNKYRAQIMVNGQNIVLGVRSNYSDAVKLRKEAEKKYFGIN